MSKLNGTELANEFSAFVNNMNCDSDEFVEAFTRQHRTLQQSMFRVLLKVVERVAESDYGRDGRNIASHETAKLLIKGWKNEVVENLIKNDGDYWTKEKAIDHVNIPIVTPSGTLSYI